MKLTGMQTFREQLAEWLKDPEFRREYDALEPEFQRAVAQIEKQLKRKKTRSTVSRVRGKTKIPV